MVVISISIENNFFFNICTWKEGRVKKMHTSICNIEVLSDKIKIYPISNGMLDIIQKYSYVLLRCLVLSYPVMSSPVLS